MLGLGITLTTPPCLVSSEPAGAIHDEDLDAILDEAGDYIEED